MSDKVTINLIFASIGSIATKNDRTVLCEQLCLQYPKLKKKYISRLIEETNLVIVLSFNPTKRKTLKDVESTVKYLRDVINDRFTLDEIKKLANEGHEGAVGRLYYYYNGLCFENIRDKISSDMSASYVKKYQEAIRYMIKEQVEKVCSTVDDWLLSVQPCLEPPQPASTDKLSTLNTDEKENSTQGATQERKKKKVTFQL